MKKILFLVTVLSAVLVNAQAFKGTNDNKFQLGASFQENATGINVTYDYGIGENMSVGLAGTYALGLNENIKDVVDTTDRLDVKVRFNANLGERYKCRR